LTSIAGWGCRSTAESGACVSEFSSSIELTTRDPCKAS
jgi:hypothetical protein